MIGGLQGEFRDLDNKYLKQNVSKSLSEISGSFRRNSIALCKMETWSSVLSEFAFWLWAEMDPANRQCLTSQAVRGIWIGGCGCYPGKRYQKIRTCLTGEVETSSSPIRLWGMRMWNVGGRNSRCEISGEGGMSAGLNSSPGRMSYAASCYPEQLHPDSPRGHAVCSPIRIPSGRSTRHSWTSHSGQ